ncbi:hypothetical protein nbrc107696_28680 [Gordonia spumicola]|uniref:SF3 helicase domain-containing protein n=2 Tax=Gordonia spumicola TaxID=589161 RepID=A0A7I9VAZ2_9ACTN|nr:hypothetical protein nbrc107696_28680 [Gordonia spumicola]
MTTTAESPAAKGGAPEIKALAGTGSGTDDTGADTDSSSTDIFDALDLAFEAIQAEQQAQSQADSSNASKAEKPATEEPADSGDNGRTRMTPAQIKRENRRELTSDELDRLAEDGIPRSRLDPDNRKSKPYAASFDTIVDVVTKRFLKPTTDAGRSMIDNMTPQDLRDSLLGRINEAITAENGHITEKRTVHRGVYRGLDRLGFVQIAKLVAAQNRVVLVRTKTGGSLSTALLAFYDSDPRSETYGTYRSEPVEWAALINRYQEGVLRKEQEEVMSHLRLIAQPALRATNRDLIAANDCIVDYNGGHPKRIEFSPDYIFLSKLPIKWNPAAENPVITMPKACTQGHPLWVCGHNHPSKAVCTRDHDDECPDVPECDDTCLEAQTWDIESWMRDLNDETDPGFSEVLWQVIGAVVRPYVSWNKCAWFVSEKGNNGKGTLLELMRNLVGLGNYASIALADLGRDFMLTSLLTASAILVDENDVGLFIEKLANFKTIATNDVLSINVKYRDPIEFQFFGFMVQCVNEEPRTKDKSGSFYRRQLFMRFRKSFTGMERKYIKDEYLKRDDVLEYVLKRVLTAELTPTYYDIEQTATMVADQNEYKVNNDPVRQWWLEFREEFVWDLLPYNFLYDHFKAWMERFNSASKPMGVTNFKRELLSLVDEEPGLWSYPDVGADGKQRRPKPGMCMSLPEPLIVEYDLTNWLNCKAPKNASISTRATLDASQFKTRYAGLERVNSAPGSVAARAAAGFLPEVTR